MPRANALQAFGTTVRQLRESQEISQEELGYRAGLHRNYVGGIERGTRNPSLLNLLKLAKGLGLTPTELFVAFDTRSTRRAP